jgi:hypothetical protein
VLACDSRIERHRLDVVIAICRLAERFAHLADEEIDDPDLRLVDSSIELVEKHLLSEDSTHTEAEELEDAIFRAGQVYRPVVNSDNPGIEG